MSIKQILSLPWTWFSWIGELQIGFSTRGCVVFLLYWMVLSSCLQQHPRQNIFVRSFPRSVTNMTWVVLYLLYLLELFWNYVSLTYVLVQKATSTLDCSEAPAPDSITTVILQNCEPKLLQIIASLFSICLWMHILSEVVR